MATRFNGHVECGQAKFRNEKPCREQRSGADGFDISYQYDQAGNRTLKTQVQGVTTTLTTSTYSDANRLETATTGSNITTYSYDSAGNQTHVAYPDSSSDVYRFDPLCQMNGADVASGTVTMTHNAARQMVRKESTDGSVTNHYFDHKRLLQETDDDDDPTHSYTHGQGGGGEDGVTGGPCFFYAIVGMFFDDVQGLRTRQVLRLSWVV